MKEKDLKLIYNGACFQRNMSTVRDTAAVCPSELASFFSTGKAVQNPPAMMGSSWCRDTARRVRSFVSTNNSNRLHPALNEFQKVPSCAVHTYTIRWTSHVAVICLLPLERWRHLVNRKRVSE